MNEDKVKLSNLDELGTHDEVAVWVTGYLRRVISSLENGTLKINNVDLAFDLKTETINLSMGKMLGKWTFALDNGVRFKNERNK